MKLKKILLSEERTKEISKKKFLNLYNKKIGIKPHKLPTIYRGKTSGMEYGFVQPREYQRESAYTKNYYTLILDNSPKWEKYPERSKSIICATKKQRARQFGTPYHVFPIIGAKLGVCSRRDLWDSFPYMQEKLEYLDLEVLNIVLDKLSRVCYGKIINDNSYNDFKESINKISECDEFRRLYEKGEFSSNTGPLLDDFERRAENLSNLYFEGNYSSLFSLLNELLDPSKNDFKTAKFGKSSLPKNVEVWTSSPSLLVHDDYFPEEIA